MISIEILSMLRKYFIDDLFILIDLDSGSDYSNSTILKCFLILICYQQSLQRKTNNNYNFVFDH